MKKPNWLKKIFNLSIDPGKNVKRIWEPSSGGMGIRLNIAKTILIKTVNPAI